MNIGGIMPEAHIAICFPSGENVCADFAVHLTSMLLKNKLSLSIFANANSSRLAYNRNALVRLAKQVNSTHILFVDADTLVPDDALEILHFHDRDIVGATASKRYDNADGPIGVALNNAPPPVSAGLVKMKVLGLPLTLIKMEVFETLREPWFAEPPWHMLGDEYKDTTALCPEDEYFCRSALNSGFDIWCDTELSLRIGHRGPKTYYIRKPEIQQLQPPIQT